jgi:hypothetical protein
MKLSYYSQCSFLPDGKALSSSKCIRWACICDGEGTVPLFNLRRPHLETTNKSAALGTLSRRSLKALDLSLIVYEADHLEGAADYALGLLAGNDVGFAVPQLRPRRNIARLNVATNH